MWTHTPFTRWFKVNIYLYLYINIYIVMIRLIYIYIYICIYICSLVHNVHNGVKCCFMRCFIGCWNGCCCNDYNINILKHCSYINIYIYIDIYNLTNNYKDENMPPNKNKIQPKKKLSFLSLSQSTRDPRK